MSSRIRTGGVGIDPLLEVTSHEGPDGWHVVKVTGEIDLSTADSVADQFNELMETGARHLVADLDEVTFMDSTALAILVHVHNRVRQQEGDLVVVCREGPAKKLLAATGLHRELNVRDSAPPVEEP